MPSERLSTSARVGRFDTATLTFAPRQTLENSVKPTCARLSTAPSPAFVLTSTSAGQEGIDFHWWSHAVVHWNLPSSPVDFEQREGRVNRFAGHAIRKNVAEQHWADVLSCDEVSPWEAAFGAAVEASRGKGDFAPWWMYPGVFTHSSGAHELPAQHRRVAICAAQA